MKREVSMIIDVSRLFVALLLSEPLPPEPELVVPALPLALETLRPLTNNSALMYAGLRFHLVYCLDE